MKIQFKDYPRLRGDREPQSKQILVNGKPIGEIEYNAHYHRHPWTVLIRGQGRIVYKGGDCFSLAVAKEAARHTIENSLLIEA